MHEVPGLQRTLFTLDQQCALTGENEEVFLRTLAVVEARRLSRLEDADVDPELLELGLALETGSRAEVRMLEPARFLRVDDEPAVTFRHQPTVLRALQLCFFDHPSTSQLLGYMTETADAQLEIVD